ILQQVQAQKLMLKPTIISVTKMVKPTKITPVVGIPFLPPTRKKPVKEIIPKKQGYNVYAKKHSSKSKYT
ncbi:unnamed protein product, partial [marine sediment metagenome]